jgi:hypothetical protein
MKTWSVTLPVTGVVYVDVEGAETADEAIEMAINGHGVIPDTPDEWDVHRQVVQGNVFYGAINRAIAELVNEDDE